MSSSNGSSPHVLITVFVFMMICHELTSGATHWVVTEDGMIRTQDDSVFTLKRPYDLVSFINQEKRAESLNDLKKSLVEQKKQIETSSGSTEILTTSSLSDDGSSGSVSKIIIDADSDMEQVVLSASQECKSAGKTLAEYDLYGGSVLFLSPKHQQASAEKANGPLFEEILREHMKVSRYASGPKRSLTSADEPKCTTIYDLDFSMYSYDHLESIRDRNDLELEPEPEIINILKTITGIDNLNDYGAAVTKALKENCTSWILFSMASYFWRGRGSALESIECIRRSLHLAPNQMKHIPLTSLGNILHRSHRSEDAAVVLKNAVDVAPDNPGAHFTLGNIYAILSDYNKSLASYATVLRLDPSFSEARLRSHAVRCHQEVERALRAQHDKLQKTLQDLQSYQKQQELWLQIQEKIRDEQAAPGDILEQRLLYRDFKLRSEILDQPSSGANSAPNTSGGGGSHYHSSPADGSQAAGSVSESNHRVLTVKMNAESCQKIGSKEGCKMVPVLVPVTYVPEGAP